MDNDWNNRTLKTVGELKKAIAEMDDNLPLVGSDGTDRDCPVMAYVHDYSDCPPDDRPSPQCIISVD